MSSLPGRVTSAAELLYPSLSLLTAPVAMAMTFLMAAAVSTPMTSLLV
ncbi:MAG: hypothetical protein IPG76_01785 [Acidobacteria bacterium]|nr:hypothetical protein [Acidobacteriota bacterium]